MDLLQGEAGDWVFTSGSFWDTRETHTSPWGKLVTWQV